jgi:hypothetical protein
MNNECGSVGIRTDRGNQSAATAPQIPHSMTWDRIQAAVMIAFELKIPWHSEEGWLI